MANSRCSAGVKVSLRTRSGQRIDIHRRSSHLATLLLCLGWSVTGQHWPAGAQPEKSPRAERGGIFHEISYDGVIRTNTVRRNGTGKDFPHWTTGAGIEIVSSRKVEVCGNMLEDNWQSITGLDDHRGSGNAGPWTLTNLNVHDNVITSRVVEAGGGRTGIIDTQDTGAFSVAAHNFFRQNSYVLGASRQYFLWQGKELDETGWQRFGQDAAGTFRR